MHNFLSLTKVLLKNSSGGMVDGKARGRKATTVFLVICIGIGLIPIPFAMYTLYDSLIQQISIIDQAGSILALTFCFSTSITFFFSLFIVPSIFYYSKDISTLLSLPLKPETILASKFTICLLYEYLFEAFIVLPAVFAYASNGFLTPLFALFFVIIFLALPILPLVYSSLITMFIMRFIPFFKDRDKFNLFSGVIGVGFGLGLSLILQSLQFDDPQMMIAMITSGQNSLIQIFSYVFPTISPAAFACIAGDVMQFIIFIGMTGIAIILLLLIAKAFYFKGAIGVSESKSNHKLTDDKTLQKQSVKKNIIYSYMLKEIRILFRTPVYFINCILIVIILPFILIVSIFSNGIEDLLSMVDTIPWNNYWLFSMILLGSAIGLLYANINSISATAISREGQDHIFMKYIPLSYAHQVYAKTLTGMLISEIGILILAIPVIIFLKVPILFTLVFLFSSSLANIMGNLIGIIVDIMHPKLVWEQETAAVKQNLNSFIMMLLGMAIAFILIFFFFKLDSDYWSMYSLIILIMTIVLIPILYKIVGKLADKRLNNI